MKRYWFKNKIYGWGWVPVSWQGWLITLGYIATLLVTATILFLLISDPRIYFWLFIPFVIGSSAYTTKLAYTFGEKPKWPWQ